MNAATKRVPKLSNLEAEALDIVRQYTREHERAILVSALCQILDIQGGTRQRLVEKMVEKNLVRKVEIRVARGRPATGLIPVI